MSGLPVSILRRALLGSIICAMSAAHAATPESTYGISATPAANKLLGSADAAVGLVTTDYSRAFDTALPPISPQRLDATIQALLAMPPQALDPLRIRAGSDIAGLFALQGRPVANGSFTVVGDSAFAMDPFTSVALYARDRRATPPLRFDVALGLRDRVAREHVELLDRIGIDRSQIQLLQMLLISSRGEDLKAPPEDTAPPEVHALMTYASRALAGVQIEGSYAKVMSAGPANVVGLDLSWPAIRFHPALRSGCCKDVPSLKRNALDVVQRVAGGDAVNILMAYVLRPVRLQGERVFVPALKIGVLPRGTDPEAKGESDLGEMVDVYVDLSIEPLSYDTMDLSDHDPR